jgi:hypothetical protein
MYKLLTEEKKAMLARVYAHRRTAVILIALDVVMVIGMVGLLPSYVLSDARRQEVAERTKIMEGLSSSEDEQELQAWLDSLNAKLKALSPTEDTDRPSELIEKILGERSDGIRLTSFVWSKEGGEALVSVSGIGRDRQSLIAFESRLNASGHFGRVTLPISNLAKDKDINFQVKLSLQKP